MHFTGFREKLDVSRLVLKKSRTTKWGRKQARGLRQMLPTLLNATNRALQLVSYSYVTVLGVLYIFQRKLQYFPFGGEPPCASAISSLCPGLRDLSALAKCDSLRYLDVRGDRVKFGTAAYRVLKKKLLATHLPKT